MNRIERLMRKLIPNLDREARERERDAHETLKRSASHRRDAENAVFTAYRKAGIEIGRESRGRKWED